MYICRIIFYSSVYACMIMIEYKIPHFLLYILYLINGVLSILTPDVPVYFQELWYLSYEVCWCMIGTWWNILWDHFGFRRMWLHRTNFFYQLPVRVKILNLVFFFIQTNYKIYGKSFSLKFCLWQLILHVGIPYLYFKEIRIKIPHVNTLTVGN